MSSINGPIARSEAVTRAQNWVDRRVPYSQDTNTNTWATDIDGCSRYRKDCSGMVSMAWHLDASLVTTTLPNRGTPISFSDVQAGDALARPGHVVMAAGPITNGKVVIYQESMPGLPAERVTRNQGDYTFAYRYKNIRDDIPTPPPTDPMPFGRVEIWDPRAGSIAVSGFVLAQTTNEPINVQVRVDKQVVTTVAANLTREDIGAYYGLGSNHGFNVTIPVSSGSHLISVHAVNNRNNPELCTDLEERYFEFSADAEAASFVNAIWHDILYRGTTRADALGALPTLRQHGQGGYVNLCLGTEEQCNGFMRDAFMTFLGRPASDSDLKAQWTGASSGMTRKQLITNVAASEECWARNSKDGGTWIAAMYRLFLGREADQAEIVATANSMAGNDLVARTAAIRQFTESEEYSERMVAKYFYDMLLRPASASDLAYYAPQIRNGDHNAVIRTLASSPEYWIASQRR